MVLRKKHAFPCNEYTNISPTIHMGVIINVIGYDQTSGLCVYHLTAAPPMSVPAPVSSDVCIGSVCSTNSGTNSGLSPVTIGATTATLFLVLILSTTVVVVGIAVGICRRKKQQHNMIRSIYSAKCIGFVILEF